VIPILFFLNNAITVNSFEILPIIPESV